MPSVKASTAWQTRLHTTFQAPSPASVPRFLRAAVHAQRESAQFNPLTCAPLPVFGFGAIYSFSSTDAALADELVTYNAGSQSEFLQQLAGVVYIGLIGYLLFKVFTRRASKFTSEKVGQPAPGSTVETEEQDPYFEEPAVSPKDSFFGAIQALGIAAIMFTLATKLDGVLYGSTLPDQYTVRNIAVTVRTILRGLVYLATFIFAANGVGLAALTLKLVLFGDDTPEEKSRDTLERDLPSIQLTSNPDDVLRAFDEASNLTKYKKEKKAN